MLRAWRTLTEIVGAKIFDSVTKRPTCNTNFEDEDPGNCPYFIDPDFK